MNLNAIPSGPFVQGIIKVESETRETGPVTLNEFRICARTHEAPVEGEPVPRLAKHAITDQLLKSRASGKACIGLTEIPIRLFFNKPDKALSIKYQAYTREGNMPVCSGDGKSCMRLTPAGDGTTTLSEHACVGNESCELLQDGAIVCRRQVKMAVQIEGQDDPLSVFEVRTSSLNTYRALQGQLKQLAVRFGGLRHIPLKLTLWQMSNQASGFAPFHLMRLVLDARDEAEAMDKIKADREQEARTGLSADALDEAFGQSESVLEFETDFELVSDFYDAAPARRIPAVSAPSATKPSAGRSFDVKDLIAQSVSLAKQGMDGHVNADAEEQP